MRVMLLTKGFIFRNLSLFKPIEIMFYHFYIRLPEEGHQNDAERVTETSM